MNSRHILPRLTGLASALAVLLTLAACGSTPSTSDTAQRSKSSDTPDALLADAMRRQNNEIDLVRALPLVKMAYDKAPDRPDIAWLYSQLCARTANCQPESSEARLRRLDPDNAAAWLGALNRAQRNRDIAAENEIIDAMSRSARFDIYWNPLISQTAVVIGAQTAAQFGPTTPDLVSGSLNDSIGWMSAVALPAFAPLSDYCSVERAANPAVAQRCRALADVLLRGDTYIAEGVGLGIQQRLAAPGTPQAAQVSAQIERARYQRETAGQIIASQADQEKFSRELIKLMASLRREQDVYLAVLRWGGRPLEPEADR